MAIRPSSNRTFTPNRVDGVFSAGEIAVPVLADDEADLLDQTKLARTLADSSDGCVHFIDPRGERDAQEVTVGDHETTEVVGEMSERFGPLNGRSGILSGRRSTRRIVSYVKDNAIDAVVLPGDFGAGSLGRRRHERLAERVPCDVVSMNGDGRFQEFASVLLPIAQGQHSILATGIATRIARDLEAWVDVLHVLPPDVEEETRQAAERELADIGADFEGSETIQPWILESDDPARTIVEQSSYYGLTVIGAPTSGRLKRLFYGSTSRKIRKNADGLVIAARRHASG